MNDRQYQDVVNYALSKREDRFNAVKDDMYYYPNVCHVCNAFGTNEKPLKICKRCNIISYCERKHQRQDWLLHKDICRIVYEMKKKAGGTNIFAALKKTVKRNASMSKIVEASMIRLRIKVELTKLVYSKLDRYMDAFEIEMFDHPRVCAVCFESNPDALTNCKNCPQASFCERHLGDPEHAKICPKLMMTFLVESNRKLFHGLVSSKKRPEVDHQTKSINLPESIKDFINFYIKVDKSCEKILNIWTAYVSELITNPLTLLYAMELLDLKPGSKLVIHVIGTDFKELFSTMWEVILHWLPDLKDLTVILVDTKIIVNEIWLQDICKSCIAKGKKMSIKFETTCYENYCKNMRFLKPDITIAYNACINSNEDRKNNLLTLPKISCPFVLTAYHAMEVYNEQKEMQFLFGNTAKPLCCQPNPFANLFSSRLRTNEEIYSDNEFLIIYNDLYKMNDVEAVGKGKQSLTEKHQIRINS